MGAFLSCVDASASLVKREKSIVYETRTFNRDKSEAPSLEMIQARTANAIRERGDRMATAFGAFLTDAVEFASSLGLWQIQIKCSSTHAYVDLPITKYPFRFEFENARTVAQDSKYVPTFVNDEMQRTAMMTAQRVMRGFNVNDEYVSWAPVDAEPVETKSGGVE